MKSKVTFKLIQSKDTVLGGSPIWTERWYKALEEMSKGKNTITVQAFKDAFKVFDNGNVALNIQYKWVADPYLHLSENPQWIYEQLLNDLRGVEHKVEKEKGR